MNSLPLWILYSIERYRKIKYWTGVMQGGGGGGDYV